MTWAERVAAAFPDSSVTAGRGESPVVTVQPADWHARVAVAKDSLGCDYFDFLTAAAEPPGNGFGGGLGGGYRIVCHLARIEPGVQAVLLQTLLDTEAPRVASVSDLFAGASWHEREMREMYGVVFEGGDQRPLLLAGSGASRPMRKEVFLPARSERPWPGAKEPGDSDAGSASGASPSRRRLRPPGVPEEHRS